MKLVLSPNKLNLQYLCGLNYNTFVTIRLPQYLYPQYLIQIYLLTARMCSPFVQNAALGRDFLGTHPRNTVVLDYRPDEHLVHRLEVQLPMLGKWRLNGA